MAGFISKIWIDWLEKVRQDRLASLSELDERITEIKFGIEEEERVYRWVEEYKQPGDGFHARRLQYRRKNIDRHKTFLSYLENERTKVLRKLHLVRTV